MSSRPLAFLHSIAHYATDGSGCRAPCGAEARKVGRIPCEMSHTADEARVAIAVRDRTNRENDAGAQLRVYTRADWRRARARLFAKRDPYDPESTRAVREQIRRRFGWLASMSR